MSSEAELEALKRALKRERKTVAHVEKLFEEKTHELYQANEALKRQQDTLIKAEKLLAIGRLAAGIAHEINNPLTFVSSNLELLGAHLNGTDKLSQEELDDLMVDVNDGVERIKSIVLRVNNYSKSNSIQRESVNINQAVLSTISLIKSRLDSNIKLTTNLADIPSIYGNLNEIKQLTLNMMMNALDAMDEISSERTGLLEITTRHNQQTDQVELVFKDNGIGMDENTLSSIFEPFFTTKEVDKGSGLGLHVCHQIVTMHQGSIDVESIQGSSTRFVISLPIDLRGEPR